MLSKGVYEVLYYINISRNSLNRIRDIFNDMDKTKKVIRKLESADLINVEMRDNTIYGFIETEKGRNMVVSPEYKQWYEELGD
jgi:hypothetical protein